DPQTGALGGSASCDGRALDARTIEALPALYVATLEAIAAAPAENWRAVRLTTASSRLTGESVDFDEADAALHELVAAQAARTPDAPAVVAGNETLTYAELDGRANQVARWLQRRGVRADDRVAVA